MSAQPIYEEDPHDPQVILRNLPERERPVFLQRYQEAVDGAKDPAGYWILQKKLADWAQMARILKAELERNPRYYDELDADREAIRNGTMKTIPIEDVFPDWNEYVAAARERRTAG